MATPGPPRASIRSDGGSARPAFSTESRTPGSPPPQCPRGETAPEVGNCGPATAVNQVGQAFSSASLFDPKTNRRVTASAMATGRDSPIGAELRDGRVLVAGGAADRQVLRSSEIYDWRSNRWTRAAQMRHAR